MGVDLFSTPLILHRAEAIGLLDLYIDLSGLEVESATFSPEHVGRILKLADCVFSH
jgi:hypothetical protein